MNIATHGTSPRPRRPLQLWTAVRDELSDRRQDRAHYRALKRELASYTTRAAVDDLLVAFEGQDGAEAEMIRSILVDNLRQPYGQLAS